MRSLLSREHYFSPEIFSSEMERIFRSTWILAAARPMVAGHLDFRTLDIGGVPVIVQNFDGRIRAFENICRHRLSRVHAGEFGKRRLQCPYHHWSYDEDGVLAGVPKNATFFQFTPEQMRSMRLRPIATEVVGGLVFVNLADQPGPISAQFDRELLDLLAAATDRMDSDYIYTRYEAGFNWKTGMENIKDPLHVQCLHRDSFPENFQTEAGLEAIPAMDHEGSARWPQARLPDVSGRWDVPIENVGGHEWYGLVENLDSSNYYRGIHLFPNVNLMIVAGTSFSIQIYNPVAPERTEMQMMVALTKPTQPFAYKPVVLWEHLRSDMAVLQEDIDCLEALQTNFRSSTNDAVHGAYEAGIANFHSVYLSLLNHENAQQRRRV